MADHVAIKVRITCRSKDRRAGPMTHNVETVHITKLKLLQSLSWCGHQLRSASHNLDTKHNTVEFMLAAWHH